MKRTVIAFFLLMSAGLYAQDAVTRAMQDEMQRSMKKLRLQQMELPYFISYKVTDTNSKQAAASFGSLLSSSENHTRMLTVEVRVGDYALDNSNFLSFQFGASGVVRMFGGVEEVPLDDNYDELRRQIWLATDGAYKKALEDLSGKRAALQNKSRTDDVPDFSKEKPSSITDVLPAAEMDLRQAERLTETLSAVFRQVPAVNDSHVRLSIINSLEHYLNSEGTTFTRRIPVVSLTVSAETQSSDGMPLSDFFSAYGHSFKDLPSEAELTADAQAVGDRLTKLQSAPVGDRYNGPVLFEGEAAAEVVAQAVARRLPATPILISDNPQFRGFAGQENPLLDKIDSRVLPDFLSLVDNPTANQADDHFLFGSYKVDEEGTPAHETTVVDNGYLKTVLTSREPVRGVLQSTGNMRERGVAPSNLFLVAQKSSSAAEVKAQFLDLVKRRGKPYGIVIRRLGDPAFRATDLEFMSLIVPTPSQQDRLEPAILAYRVYLDGHEELIRNVGVAGISMDSLKDIVAVSNTRTVYAAPFSGRASSPFVGVVAGGAPMVVSYVVPSSLLFEDLAVQKPSGEIPKPPISKHPYFDKP
jgi:hypothetical protein